MDWGVVAIISTIVVSVGTLVWGVVSHRQSRVDADEKHLVESIEELNKWKSEVTTTIEQLRQEIDHVKEICDLKDAAAREHLARLESKVDELLSIVIRFVSRED